MAQRDRSSSEESTRHLSLRLRADLRAAARYYQEFIDEVDAWITEVDREAEEAYPHRAAR